ncbi:hypothetical protein ACMC9I_11475 [Deinococcota bacterium DY0809b]
MDLHRRWAARRAWRVRAALAAVLALAAWALKPALGPWALALPLAALLYPARRELAAALAEIDRRLGLAYRTALETSPADPAYPQLRAEAERAARAARPPRPPLAEAALALALWGLATALPVPAWPAATPPAEAVAGGAAPTDGTPTAADPAPREARDRTEPAPPPAAEAPQTVEEAPAAEPEAQSPVEEAAPPEPQATAERSPTETSPEAPAPQETATGAREADEGARAASDARPEEQAAGEAVERAAETGDGRGEAAPGADRPQTGAREDALPQSRAPQTAEGPPTDAAEAEGLWEGTAAPGSPEGEAEGAAGAAAGEDRGGARGAAAGGLEPVPPATKGAPEAPPAALPSPWEQGAPPAAVRRAAERYLQEAPLPPGAAEALRRYFELDR